MTNNFQEGVLASHKPPRVHSEASSYPLHQENSQVQLENLRPLTFQKINFY
jgi:hypothetical protein